MSVSTSFTYNVEDINNSVRRTNVLLRAANAVRLTFRDLKQVMEKPTFTNIMWTLIQLSRTYNALRRLLKLINKETTVAAAVFNFIVPEAEFGTTVSAEPFLGDVTPQSLNVRVDAFRENLPMPLEGLDISNIPQETVERIQALLEEDAEETVMDAKAILVSRILHPEDSTGTLEASIGWMPETFGTRIYANAFYAWWVEEGQRTFTGHHYLKGATDLARQRLPEKIRFELNQLIFQGT